MENELITVEPIDTSKLSEEHNVDVENVTTITTGLNVFIDGRSGLIEKYNKISDVEVTIENLPIFKKLRLKFQKNRTKGTNDWHKKAKEIPLRMGQLIDAIKRNQNQINESYESALLQKENHFVNIEKERLAKLQKEREEQLSEYIDDAATRDLAGMDDLTWNALLSTCKRNHEERMEAEKKAEAERIEKKRLDNLERVRLDIILPYRDFWPDKYNVRDMTDTEFDSICSDLKKWKEDHDKEQARIKAENDRLKKERKEAAEKARKEREEIERKNRERLEKEEAARKKVEAELQKKRDEEAKAKREKEEAEKKAARAPDKDKIDAYISAIYTLSVSHPTVMSKEAKQIIAHAHKKLSELVTTLKTQSDRM